MQCNMIPERAQLLLEPPDQAQMTGSSGASMMLSIQCLNRLAHLQRQWPAELASNKAVASGCAIIDD